LFLYFEVISSLKISLAKLEFVCAYTKEKEKELVHVSNVNNVEGLVRILGCRVSFLPIKYLGLWVCRLKPNLFGMALLRRLNIHWLVGSGCTCLKGVGLP
jgi:hypothetical protein